MNSLTQPTLFDGKALKEAGIKKVASHNAEWLAEARRYARLFAGRPEGCTSDDVRDCYKVIPTHPNAWGAVFRSPEFEWTGEVKISTTPSCHGRMIRVWRLKR